MKLVCLRVLHLLAVIAVPVSILAQPPNLVVRKAPPEDEAIASSNIARPNITITGDLLVNSFTGNLFHRRTDLFIPGRGLSISLTFSYNSGLSSKDWGYGPGWTMSYNIICERAGENILVRRSDGRKDLFTFNGSGYASPTGVYDSLTEYSPGKFEMRSRSGIRYLFEDATHGRLTSIIDRNNNVITISYAGSHPVLITDPSGRSVALQWAGEHCTGILDSIHQPPHTITYSYDARGNLASVMDPSGHTRTYGTNPAGQLSQITDPVGTTCNIEYHSSGAVRRASTPVTDQDFTYNPTNRSTEMTMPIGGKSNVSKHTFDPSGNVVNTEWATCCGPTARVFGQNGTLAGYPATEGGTSWTYDSEYNVLTSTDPNGGTTSFSYDSHGNRTSQTDPLGGIITTTYDPVLNKPVSVTDRNGNTTLYTYDAAGNILSVHRPLGVTEEFTYDAFGNLSSWTNGRGFVTHYSYNANGDVIDVSDEAGSRHYTYDNAGNRLTETDRRGNTTTFTYDPLDRLLTAAGPEGGVIAYSYDANGNQTSITDANGHTTSYTYDALNRLVKTTDALGGITTRFYNEIGRLLAVTDPRGTTTSYEYDSRNFPSAEINALGQRRTFSYDAAGNKIAETDFRGNATTYTYDALNRVLRIDQPLGRTVRFSYDANGNRISVIDPRGNAIGYTYDALNRPVHITLPLGALSFAYDAASNLISTTDPNGHVSSNSYDALNRLVAQTDALGNTTTSLYDANGNRTSVTDPLGHSSAFTYTATNRMSTSTNGAGETTVFTYDPAGNLSTVTSPNGNTVIYTCNALGKVTGISDNLGTLQSFAYDQNSNRLTVTDGNGHTVVSTYDALNRLISATDPLGASSSSTFDPDGHLLSTTDRDGKTTSYTYDALGRKSSVTDPGGGVTHYGYDPVGNLVIITDGNGNQTTAAFDGNNRLITETFPDGSAKHYGYDDAGNVILRTDNNGAVTAYQYDANNRLLKRDHPGSDDDVYTYDAAGRMATASNAAGVVTFGYDAAGRKLSENQNGLVTSTAYNIAGRSVAITSPGGRMITRQTDDRGRVTQVLDGATALAWYTYDPGGRVTGRTSANGAHAAPVYDDGNRVLTYTHTVGSTTIAGFRYTYSPEGIRQSEVNTADTLRSEDYGFDVMDRLTDFRQGAFSGDSIPSPSEHRTFSYDYVGNRVSMGDNGSSTAYSTNSLNEYTTVSGPDVLHPTYDLNGNCTSDGRHTYMYDSENRIIAVDGGSTAVYTYDALSRRIKKVAGSSVTNYYYDGQQMIEERNESNVVTASYVYGLVLNELISVSKGGFQYYYHQNYLGSIIALTDNTGSVVERYEYDAYGRTTVLDTAYHVRPSSVIGNTVCFTGQILDAESGLYYMKNRYYSPSFGRFLQRDPVGFRDGLNLFEYAKDDPTDYTDPLGLSCTEKNVGDCTTVTLYKTDWNDSSTVNVPALGGFRVIVSHHLQADFKYCKMCCSGCYMSTYGGYSLTGVLGFQGNASYVILDVVVAQLTATIYLNASIAVNIECAYNGCNSTHPNDCCGTLTWNMTLGARIDVIILFGLFDEYAGAELSGSCNAKYCLAAGFQGGKCCLTGRLYAGIRYWWVEHWWPTKKTVEVSYNFGQTCFTF